MRRINVREIYTLLYTPIINFLHFLLILRIKSMEISPPFLNTTIKTAFTNRIKRIRSNNQLSNVRITKLDKLHNYHFAANICQRR